MLLNMLLAAMLFPGHEVEKLQPDEQVNVRWYLDRTLGAPETRHPGSGFTLTLRYLNNEEATQVTVVCDQGSDCGVQAKSIEGLFVLLGSTEAFVLSSNEMLSRVRRLPVRTRTGRIDKKIMRLWVEKLKVMVRQAVLPLSVDRVVGPEITLDPGGYFVTLALDDKAITLSEDGPYGRVDEKSVPNSTPIVKWMMGFAAVIDRVAGKESAN